MPLPTKDEAYRADLAQIHHEGFGDHARAASQVLLESLKSQQLPTGLVVDLGCGSGILSLAVDKAGYDVLGYDISPAMVELARRLVPSGKFHCASILDATLPACVAVTAVGEVFNYLFDRRNSAARLNKLLGRIEQALVPGGLLLFDVALVGREPTGRRRSFSEGPNWACLFEAIEDGATHSLTRTITTFCRQGDAYRRDHEVHKLRLFQKAELIEPLKAIGFRTRILRGYGEHPFPPGYMAVVAKKPK